MTEPTTAEKRLQKQVDGMREEGCAAIGALENIFVGATSPEEIERGDPTVQKIAEIASRVLATAEHCDHKAQRDEAQEQLIYWWKTQHSCPCGARAESLDTHPHVLSCPTERAFLARQAEEPTP